MTIAPFNFPRNFSRSSFVFASTYTSGPRTIPFVPGDHPAAAIVSGWTVGLTMLACAGPRVQERAMLHGSSFTPVRPYSRNLAAVHSFACFNCGEPVSRGPISSDRYSRFSIAWLGFWISLRICASAAATALASSPAGRAKPARTAASRSTAQNTTRTTRRTFIRSPLPYSAIFRKN